ncbi:MAG: beta-ketoacyl-[acyl-carrier-protein] synthase family protein [Candidatus Obscuribacterales bacterium]|nr:beta-ketoacyl-[acyl-carrier-protein] synthase family protein [Steroidobacteraceae bacterium]
MKHERVLVTGVGVLTSIATGFDDFASALQTGRCGAARLTGDDASIKGIDNLLFYKVRDFDPAAHFDRRSLRRMDPCAQLAVVAARQAVAHADLDPSSVDPQRSGVVFGTVAGGASNGRRYGRRLAATGHRHASLLYDYPYYSAGARIVGEFGWRGPNLSFSTGCASSGLALGYAAELVRQGQMDVVLAGGGEAFNRGTIALFDTLRLLAKDAMRPFDQGRTGTVLGEAAAFLCLESESHAQRRGRQPLAEILGWGGSAEAFHMTAAEPTGRGIALAMSRALDRAGVKPGNIEYINAHGNSTFADVAESRAIRKVFGAHAAHVPVSSTKAMYGNVNGASGAVEAVTVIAAMRDSFIPPTINFVTPDPRCVIDCVPNQARPQRLKIAMSNNSGFGGAGSSLVLRSCFTTSQPN